MALTKTVTISPSAAASAGCTATCVGKRTSDDASGWVDEYTWSATAANGWKFVKFTWTRTTTTSSGKNESYSDSTTKNTVTAYDYRIIWPTVTGQPWEQYVDSNIVAHFEQEGSSGGGGEETGTYDIAAYANSEYGGDAIVEPEVYYDVPIGTKKSFKFTATAFDGYIFEHWIDDDTDATYTSNPLTRTPSSPSEPGSYYISYTACFRLAETYKFTATVDPAGGGTVNGLDRYEQTFKEGESTTVSVKAVPNEGYAFYRWSHKRNDGYYDYEHSWILSKKISKSQEWVAEFTNNLSINVAIKIIPNSADHGAHGMVSIEKTETDEIYEFENSGSLLLSPASMAASQTTIKCTINAYDGFVANKIRYKTGESKDVWVKPITTNPYIFSISAYDGACIEVFFGCGKILYEKETGKLLEHNGKLVYCG